MNWICRRFLVYLVIEYRFIVNDVLWTFFQILLRKLKGNGNYFTFDLPKYMVQIRSNSIPKTFNIECILMLHFFYYKNIVFRYIKKSNKKNIRKSNVLFQHFFLPYVYTIHARIVTNAFLIKKNVHIMICDICHV